MLYMLFLYTFLVLSFYFSRMYSTNTRSWHCCWIWTHKTLLNSFTPVWRMKPLCSDLITLTCEIRWIWPPNWFCSRGTIAVPLTFQPGWSNHHHISSPRVLFSHREPLISPVIPYVANGHIPDRNMNCPTSSPRTRNYRAMAFIT